MPMLEHEDPAMTKVRGWMDSRDPKVSLQELGERMGFPAESARKSAWQFLQCKVPRLDTLRRFASASGIPIEELVAEPKSAAQRKGARHGREAIRRAESGPHQEAPASGAKSCSDKETPRGRKKGC